MLAIFNIVLSVCERSFSFSLQREKLKRKANKVEYGKNVVSFICVLDYNVCCSLWDVSEPPIISFFFSPSPLPTPYHLPLPL